MLLNTDVEDLIGEAELLLDEVEGFIDNYDPNQPRIPAGQPGGGRFLGVESGTADPGLSKTPTIRQYFQMMIKARGGNKPKGWKYGCIEELLEKEGIEFKGSPRPPGVWHGPMKLCYENAWRLADNVPDVYTYVEGMATSASVPNLPLNHAWVVDNRTGQVVDPTWKDGREYIGIPLDREFVRKTLLEKGTYGVIDNMEQGFPLLKDGIKATDKVRIKGPTDNFDPDQPRDEQGQWTDEPGSGGGRYESRMKELEEEAKQERQKLEQAKAEGKYADVDKERERGWQEYHAREAAELAEGIRADLAKGINSDPKSPEQTHVRGYTATSESQPLKKEVVESYTFSSANANTWWLQAAKEYGQDPVEQALKIVPSERIQNMARYRISAAPEDFGYPPGTWIKQEEITPELIERAKQIVVGDLRGRLTEAVNRGFNPNRFNADAVIRTVQELREEAQSVVKKPEVVHRGIQFSTDFYPGFVNRVRTAIQEQGFFDLPVTPTASYTSSEKLAERFAKSGQTGNKLKDSQGILYSTEVNKDNVWMHHKQPTFKAHTNEMKAKGEKFHIGGSDQKEVVVGHPSGYVRLTKENTRVYDGRQFSSP